jgi:hypothetical protein
MDIKTVVTGNSKLNKTVRPHVSSPESSRSDVSCLLFGAHLVCATVISSRWQVGPYIYNATFIRTTFLWAMVHTPTWETQMAVARHNTDTTHVPLSAMTTMDTIRITRPHKIQFINHSNSNHTRLSNMLLGRTQHRYRWCAAWAAVCNEKQLQLDSSAINVYKARRTT